MLLRQIFDPHLAQYAYLIGCQRTGEAIVIDPERDVERYRQIAEDNDLAAWSAVAETHIAHAYDFVSGARALLVETCGAHWLYLSAEGGARLAVRVGSRGLTNASRCCETATTSTSGTFVSMFSTRRAIRRSTFAFWSPT